ncbi:MAG: alpha-L-fucosidase [Puniceicoccaceae bacterium]
MKEAVLLSLLLVATQSVVFSNYIDQSWESMAEHYSVPEWFQEGKIGVWTHWGVPSGTDENRPNDGSHYGRRMYGANEGESGAQLKMTETLTEWHTQFYGHPSEFGYEDLVPLFKAEKWDPDALVAFFKDCGARFIMPVATHHDNFDMYDSFHPWNAVDMGPKRDTIQEWKDAAYRHGLKFGVSTHLYWSPRFFNSARKYQKPGTLEWKLFNMDFDPKNYSRQDSWNEHWYARCWEIIEKYDPDMFNNDSPYPSEKTGKSLGLKLFSDFVNRDLEENKGEQTVVLSFKDGKRDRRAFTYNLERGSAGEIKPEPWMWATDLSGGWFYRKGAVNRMSIPVMVGNAVDAISKNGVVMLNVALRGDGTLPENQAAYLTTFRDFIKTCGEGIYGTRPWKVFGEGPLKMKDGRQGENHSDFCQEDIRFTLRPSSGQAQKNDTLYAFVLAKPTEDIVIKTLASGGLYEAEIESVTLLGCKDKMSWKRTSAGLVIQLPKKLPDIPVIGFRIVEK